MKAKFLIISVLFLLTSCFPKMYHTSSKGVRFEKPSKYWLKYKGKKYNNGQRIKIDTNYVYEEYFMSCPRLPMRDSTYYSDDEYQRVARFFSSGQVLFFDKYQTSIPFEKQVNDSLAGIPGYFAVEGNILKFQKWTNTAGDQTPDTYGIILNDSTLKIYNSSVPNCQGLFSLFESTIDCLEAKECYTIWKRTKKYKLEHYTPSW